MKTMHSRMWDEREIEEIKMPCLCKAASTLKVVIGNIEH